MPIAERNTEKLDELKRIGGSITPVLDEGIAMFSLQREYRFGSLVNEEKTTMIEQMTTNGIPNIAVKLPSSILDLIK
ncbi:MAG: hypothetical protein LWX70_05715 [Sphingobacteriia bacterium]|nr:hypothetical protein [Sphingobacteriia bacterium]